MSGEPAAERFARAEPLFSVLTSPRYLRSNLTPRASADFFDSGEAYVASTMEFIHSRFDRHFTAEAILEYGCGPGRLAIPFARRANRVVAVDRSNAMLESAARFANDFGVRNIEFQTPGDFARSGERFDLVNCHLVLQRVPRDEGLAILRMLLARVGEVGVFHLPFRDRSSALSRVTRRIRQRSGIANAAANLLLRKPLHMPLIPTTVYDTNDVLAIFSEAGFESLQVTTAVHDTLDTVTFFVRRRAVLAPAVSDKPRSEATPDTRTGWVDVRQLIAGTPIEEWNRRAEIYFSGLPTWEHHLMKPFSTPDETPGLLMNLAVVLQGLRITPGQTVLDFGAGTGWLSRILTQLGCSVIVLDVSETALRMAEATFREIPVIGNRPEPAYLQFDGRTIPLPDESVDRIVSFDAFHHAPNPDDVIREFGRILKPGGIAGFAEPGPTHSQAPQSQFEMRTYGVLENDIDLPALWETAQAAGFHDLKVAAFNVPAFHVSLNEFQDLLAGGQTYARWADSTRDYLRDVRDFFLIKRGTEVLDSRRPEHLRASIRVELPAPVRPDEPIVCRAAITNIGAATWLPSSDDVGGVWVGAHLFDGGGRLIEFEHGQFPISSAPIQPDETVEVSFTLGALGPGRYKIEFDCVSAHVAWFGQTGSRTETLEVVVTSR